MPILKNARHELFAQAVVKGNTIGKAYTLAGFKPHPANPIRLRDNEKIAARISEIKASVAQKVENKLEISLERITLELARMGFSNISDVLTIDKGKVRVRDTKGLSQDVTAAIKSVRKTRDGIAIEMHDKRAALVDLGKHMGYFKENINLNVTVSLADLVNASYRPDLPALPAPAKGEE